MLLSYRQTYTSTGSSQGEVIMSEIERLIEDIQKDAALMKEVESFGGEPEALVKWANERGYAFSLQELQVHIEAQNAQLTDDDLDKVAGGIRVTTVAPRIGPNPGLGMALAFGGVANLPNLSKKRV